MGSGEFRGIIDWPAMGIRYDDFFPHLMGRKASARAWRLWERAKEKAIAKCIREGRKVPFL